MSALVTFHPLAAKEYVAARRWYERRREGLGLRFAFAVNAALEKIEEAPERWPKFSETYGWVKTSRFPYVLYYHIVRPDLVLVVAVAHARRRPGYWRKRLDHP